MHHRVLLSLSCFFFFFSCLTILGIGMVPHFLILRYNLYGNVSDESCLQHPKEFGRGEPQGIISIHLVWLLVELLFLLVFSRLSLLQTEY